MAGKLGKSLRAASQARWQPRPEVLLCGNIPKPMHGLAPRGILGATWWNQTRRQAYKSTYYHCVACGVYKKDAKLRQWLEGHELYTVDYLTGRMYYQETVPLCHCCHNYIHDGRLTALLEQGKLSHQKYVTVMQHGDAVLAAAGLKKPTPYSGPFTEWGDWRLVLFGKEYPPIYKTYEEWLENVSNRE